MQPSTSFTRSTLALALLCGLLQSGQAAAEVRRLARPSMGMQASPNVAAAATAQIEVKPWSTLDFEQLTLGQTRTMDVVVMSRSRPAGMPDLPSFGGTPVPLPQMRIQGGAAGDYLVSEELQIRPFRRYGAYGTSYDGWDWIATVQFRPSKTGARKAALTLEWEDGRKSGQNLVGIGMAPGSAVQMHRPGVRPGAMVSLVGNPTTIGVNVLGPEVPKKVRMCPEPLSPNAAWETVFPIKGKPEQPYGPLQVTQGGKILGANAADFVLAQDIVQQKGAPASRLITFSPRGSGLRTAEYTQLQFDGSSVTVVLEGYGK